jgi:hypothetical protein
MLFFFVRGRYGPAIRAIAGVALLVAGIVIHAPIFIGLGAVLIVWGLITAGTVLRARQRARADDSGRMS